jgi:threonylcarbamoyladenosine tRNA methylthiotransferase MtaB
MQYFRNQQLGSTRAVLFEQQEKNGMLEGYTDNYIRVSTPYQQSLEHQIIDWEIR